tara:strand:- start:46098 stop:47813 length:1716 start_codon:yes stop_codon:yes gene_type:complete
VEPGPHGLRVVAANSLAKQAGVQAGLPLTDARSRLPELLSEEIDRASDTRAMNKLIEWLVRFTPLIARDGEDGLMLETTGCDHLFGGEAGMADELRARLDETGYSVRMAFASTPAAAWALARGGERLSFCAEGEEQPALSGLPMMGLRLSPETCQLLRRFGLTRIGQLYGMDRKALARRFQSAEAAGRVVLRLDQALGLRHEPLKPFRPKPDFSARLSCPEPIASTEAVWEGLRRVTETLCADLTAAGQGARAFSFHAFKADGKVSTIAVRAARPVRQDGHILRLFAERIDKIDPGFGIDLFLLEARLAGPVEAGPMALSAELSGKARDDVALAALGDRVSARLGDGAVILRWPVASHLPERAEDMRVFEGVWPERQAAHETGPRPLRVFSFPEPVQVLAEVPDGPPLRFVWRKQTRRVVRADGPERIAPEWWRFVEIRENLSPGEERGKQLDFLSDCSVAIPSPSAPGDLRLHSRLCGDPHDQGSGADASSGMRDNSIEQVNKTTPQSASRSPLIPNPSPHEGEKGFLPRAKDYYRVEDEEGRRYWIARVGLYHDGRSGTPYWVMAGVFS